MLAGGWAEQEIPEEQLFDLHLDPNEARNRAGEPAYQTVLDDMRVRLETWMRETDDPLLKGPVSAPAGAELNLPDQLSPAEPTTFV